MTKLTELDATFVAWDGSASGNFAEIPTIVGATGVMFDCPKCGGHSVLVWDRTIPSNIDPGPGRWDMFGTDLEDLTINPSINLTGPGCGWHGWVKNGDAT